MPRQSRHEENWQAARETLIAAAHAAGIEPGVLVRIAGFESGFDHGARPIARNERSNRVEQFDGVMAVSSAYGYGQLVDGTWVSMLRKYGNRYGIEDARELTKEQANDPRLRRDPQLQAAMLAEFTRENLRHGALVGGSDANANVYAFHNLGQRDATRFLQRLEASPQSRVDSVLPAAVVRGNPALYGDGSRTIVQSYAAMAREMTRFDRFAQDVGPEPLGNALALPAQDGGDDRLPLGEKGQGVERLQRQLDALGYRDANGNRLVGDGDFGRRTEEALKAFQRAHGLPAVGYVGPKTQAALDTARAKGPSPVDPAHPDHALHQQISRAVDAMEHANGRTPDRNSERLKASLLVAARAQGLARVDHVVLSEGRGDVQAGQNVFAVQGRLDDPASRRVHVSTQQALATPSDASWARLAQLEAARQARPPLSMAHAVAAGHGHGEYGAGLRRCPSP